MAPGEIAYDVAAREYDEAMRDFNDAAIVTTSDAEIDFQGARRLAQACLQYVHQQNPI